MNTLSRRMSYGQVNEALDGYAAPGSGNAYWLGEGYWKPFRGMDTQGANTGSLIMRPVGKTWGGIKNIISGSITASGTVSEEISRSLWGIGSGQVHIAGTDVSGFTLSTLLKLCLLSSGTYGSPITAGLAQPSAPDLAVSTEIGSPDGAISCKIERWRTTTGGHSLASPTSEVVIPRGNKVRVTFPAASAGQTHWRVFFTISGFGGQGIHYCVPYPLGSSGSLDISETTVAASTIDGVARSLLFDWKDGDLVPLEASIDDYSPQAATHHIRLENVMNLVGSFADAVSSPTTTSTGTAIQVSKTNNYESYVPTHLLYLPEQVVDVLARPIDQFGLIGCQNSLHAIQYVGPRDDDGLPACTITTISQDVGIQYAWNWCHFRGRVAVYTAEGNLLLMNENGSMDTLWASKIRRFIQGWAPVDTVLGYDPKNDCIVLFNGREAIAYSLQNEDWSLPFYLDDYGITAGSVASCQTAGRRLYVSVKNGTAFTAYEFDTGAGSTVKGVSFVSHYTEGPGRGVTKNINQLGVALETNQTGAAVVCLNRNLQQIAARGITSTSSSTTIGDANSSFNAGMTGKQYALFGTNIGGAGVHYIIGTFIYVSAGSATLSVAPQITATNLLLYIGDYIVPVTPQYAGAAHLPDLFPNVPDCRSYAFAMWIQTNDAISGSPLEANVYGNYSGSGRATNS